ncbi:MAG TPA: L,D-transpeptidase [Gaiellaceae bacterium]
MVRESTRIRDYLVSSSAVFLAALVMASAATARTDPPGSSSAGAACRPGERRALTGGVVALAGLVRRPTAAFHAPGRAEFARFGLVNENRFPTVFSVVGEQLGASCRATWYHVELPLKPNGTTGWVVARDVRLARVSTKIVVDVSSRKLMLLRRGRLVLRTAVAVGADATPTPKGRYYINQRLVPSDPRGPFGPAALGVSAFSNVLTGWAQGGPVGIHGTNEPWSIGRPVSNGCIRVPNAVIRRLFAAVPAGTPVIIRT